MSKTQLDINPTMNTSEAMQKVAEFYLKHSAEAIDFGHTDRVIVRCGSSYAITRHHYLKQNGQHNIEPSEEGSDLLTGLSNTCKHLVDLQPASVSFKVAHCIVKALTTYSESSCGYYMHQNLSQEELTKLLESADQFAIQPLLQIIIETEVAKPLRRGRKNGQDILQQFNHHPRVLDAVLNTMQSRIDKTVVKVDDIWGSISSNAITLVLRDYCFGGVGVTLRAEACGFVIINWSRVDRNDLGQYPAWMLDVEEHTSREEPRNTYTCLNFPQGTFDFVNTIPAHCDWGIRSGYGIRGMMIKHVSTKVLQVLVQNLVDNVWRCSLYDQQCDISFIMACKSKNDAELVFRHPLWLQPLTNNTLEKLQVSVKGGAEVCLWDTSEEWQKLHINY